MTVSKLGIIAGGGDLPKKIVNWCRRHNRPHFVLAFKDQTDPDTVYETEHAWVRVGAVGQSLELMRIAGVEELVMAGPLHRPAWTELRPDKVGARWLTILAKKAFGDDSLLRIITSELEKEGFHVVGADAILGEELMAQEGLLGKIKPDEVALRDIDRALEVAKAIGSVDVGQAVVVQSGMVLGVEAIEGTAQLLDRCGPLHRKGLGGILLKITKPNQERRVDLPTIGPDTILQVHKAGLRGIVLEAGGVQILHKQEVIDLADKKKIFLMGIPVEH